MLRITMLPLLKRCPSVAYRLVSFQSLLLFGEVEEGLEATVKERLGFDTWPFYQECA